MPHKNTVKIDIGKIVDTLETKPKLLVSGLLIQLKTLPKINGAREIQSPKIPIRRKQHLIPIRIIIRNRFQTVFPFPIQTQTHSTTALIIITHKSLFEKGLTKIFSYIDSFKRFLKGFNHPTSNQRKGFITCKKKLNTVSRKPLV